MRNFWSAEKQISICLVVCFNKQVNGKIYISDSRFCWKHRRRSTLSVCFIGKIKMAESELMDVDLSNMVLCITEWLQDKVWFSAAFVIMQMNRRWKLHKKLSVIGSLIVDIDSDMGNWKLKVELVNWFSVSLCCWLKQMLC